MTKRQALIATLKHFEFGRHKSNRWLLLEREKRESILRQAQLLELIDWQAEPIHVGDISRSNSSYEWGHVVFKNVVKGFDLSVPCSVYAAFEYLIRRSQLFPSFISLADLHRCSGGMLETLPVYGARITLDDIAPAERPAATNKMLQIHQIERRKELLVEQAFEVSDAELFEHYFKDRFDSPQAEQTAADDDDETGLDSIDVYHT